MVYKHQQTFDITLSITSYITGADGLFYLPARKLLLTSTSIDTCCPADHWCRWSLLATCQQTSTYFYLYWQLLPCWSLMPMVYSTYLKANFYLLWQLLPCLSLVTIVSSTYFSSCCPADHWCRWSLLPTSQQRSSNAQHVWRYVRRNALFQDPTSQGPESHGLHKETWEIIPTDYNQKLKLKIHLIYKNKFLCVHLTVCLYIFMFAIHRVNSKLGQPNLIGW